MAAPASSAVQRVARYITVYNKDSITHAVTFQENVGGTKYIRQVVSVAPGLTAQWGDGLKVWALDATNKTIEVLLGESATTQCDVIADWGDFS